MTQTKEKNKVLLETTKGNITLELYDYMPITTGNFKALVKSGVYSNRSDVIRDAVRRFVWDKEIETISNKGNSEAVIRKIRDKLSKEKIDLNEINKL